MTQEEYNRAKEIEPHDLIKKIGNEMRDAITSSNVNADDVIEWVRNLDFSNLIVENKQDGYVYFNGELFCDEFEEFLDNVK